MAEIRVKKVDSEGRGKKNKLRKLYAEVAYHYPQYTLKDAENLSARDLTLLLKTARKMEGIKMHNLTLIAAAPHGKNAVKKLLENFKKDTDF